GIRSSVAQGGSNGHSTGLGYAEASSVLTYSNGTASFSGQTLSDNTAVLVRYTLRGDANLSGTVDLTDFTFLAANFNKSSGAQWLDGDFNYDDKVDLTDFTFLASNFNQTVGPSSGLESIVPEPASIGAILLIAGSLLTSRQRHS